ncbi:MAG: L-2-hydroxyglutarate oxidase [Planctomycetota bacterium]
MSQCDLIVIGGGIVGLATGLRFGQRFPGKRVVVLEKESTVATHQTGRNSGVLHSGIYYRPGSLKAQLCLAGKQAIEDFCREESIPFERCGKVIVAVEQPQVATLEDLRRRGEANGVASELIDAQRLKDYEPHAAGVAALHVPSTGIVDYVAVAERLAERIADAGGSVVTRAEATAIRTTETGVTVETPAGAFTAQQAVNCAGLQSDRVAKLSGAASEARIVPFRGEYYKLTAEAGRLVRNLIYPTPDVRFPFLGVHFTRMVDGSIECGPNAVLALAREGYTKTSIDLADLAGSLTYTGFLRLAARHWRMGAGEAWRSVSKAAFVRALQRLVPDITAGDLIPAPAGIRAQAVLPDGDLVDDFLISAGPRVMNVVNAPSPAATASLAIGDTIVGRLAPRFS